MLDPSATSEGLPQPHGLGLPPENPDSGAAAAVASRTAVQPPVLAQNANQARATAAADAEQQSADSQQVSPAAGAASLDAHAAQTVRHHRAAFVGVIDPSKQSKTLTRFFQVISTPSSVVSGGSGPAAAREGGAAGAHAAAAAAAPAANIADTTSIDANSNIAPGNAAVSSASTAAGNSVSPASAATSQSQPLPSGRTPNLLAPLTDPRHISSPIFETSLLLSALVKHRVRTLVFAKVRKVAELILKHARSDLNQTAPFLAEKLQSYRAGYNLEDRRALERALFQGEILGTTATNALELGIDIGSLDATLLLGFPGSIASMWQQAGRSGRGIHPALTILVLFNSPLDQFFGRHPRQLFERQAEAAICDPSNPYVLREHLLCAASELPLRITSADVSGKGC